MKHPQKKKIEMTRNLRMLAILLVPMIALFLGAAVPELWANDDDDEEDMPFDEAELFFELNNTDGDLGIHALIDGELWKRLEIEDLKERKMLDVKVRGRLRRQGLTQLFFESAEPPFDELAPKKFFERFPAGEYEVEGISLEGAVLESEVELTHLMPAPSDNATVTDGENDTFSFPKDAEDECVDPDDESADLPTIGGDVTVAWDQVTMSHPTIGNPTSSDAINVIRYQAVAEWKDDEGTFVSSFDLLPPENAQKMSVTFPEQFFKPGAEVKFEILVREESYNQTAIESCPFVYEGDD
jgi:hypothetical protein